MTSRFCSSIVRSAGVIRRSFAHAGSAAVPGVWARTVNASAQNSRLFTTASSFTSVTNSSTLFDPRKFLEEDITEERLANLRKSLVYRSKQTGWLETDLIMGRWVDENINQLTNEQLGELCDLVQAEINDVFKWIVGQAELPEELKDSTVMKALQEYAKTNPPAKAPPV